MNCQGQLFFSLFLPLSLSFVVVVVVVVVVVFVCAGDDYQMRVQKIHFKVYPNPIPRPRPRPRQRETTTRQYKIRQDRLDRKAMKVLEGPYLMQLQPTCSIRPSCVFKTLIILKI
jgi:hypothetical protein